MKTALSPSVFSVYSVVKNLLCASVSSVVHLFPSPHS